MHLERITLANFRCFGPAQTNVDLQKQVTGLVGGNGSGKTAMFQALSRLFGVTQAQRSVTRGDFHVGAGEAGLPDGRTLQIECLFGFPELEGGDAAAADAVPEFFNHMAASGPGAPLKVRIRLQARWTDDGTPDGSVEEDIRWITTLDENFDWEACQRITAVERASIQLIYVPALRNASDRVTELLKGRLWKAARWSQELVDRAGEGAGVIHGQFLHERPANFILERLTRRWQQVHEADTDTTPVLRLVENRFEELVRRAEFSFHPDEAGRERSVSDLSDGQRSLFHIALTAATLEAERDALAMAVADSPFDQEKLRRTHLTILAIEEPENSLSPFFLSRIMIQAREIGNLPAAQVLISSHSASILSRIEPEEVRYFRLDRRTRSSSIRSITLPAGDVDARNYVRLAVRAYPELYFARFVILAEGDSERIVLPRLAEAMGVSLDPSFVPVVPLGGRYVDHFWRLLSDLGIPHATLVDFDLGRTHGGAGTIKTLFGSLQNVGRDFAGNELIANGTVSLANLATLEDAQVLNRWEQNQWLQALKHEGVFVSDPIDLDFAMLGAFPAAYQHARPGGLGPRTTPDAIAQKKATVLKTGGTPAVYADSGWDNQFIWYPYLFLDSSKPESHLSALGRISSAELARNAPSELRALVEHVRQTIAPAPEAA